MKFDLHMHSAASSDGQYSPQELADLCEKSDLEAAALTDHNSIANVKAFVACMREKGLIAIPGVELDCDCQDVHLHLLGYGIDAEDGPLQELEQSLRQQKKAAARQSMQGVRQMGIFFDEEKVLALGQDGVICGEMIAEVALADKRNDGNPLLLPYREENAAGRNPLVDFYWDYCGPGKPGYVQLRFPTFEKAMELIKNAGGFAVIAHPAVTVGRREEMIRYMADCGVAGIEVFSSYHKPEDVDYYRKLADELGLVKTCGSDFHGKIKPAVHLGDAQGMTENDREALEIYLKGALELGRNR